jgi:hypothetical protein
MAQEVTLDAIIRRNLAMRKLPLHYYLPVLVFAKRGLDEMHFHALQKLKVVTLEIDPVLKTASLPLDFVEEVVVGVRVGDKIRPLGYNHRLNRADSAEPFPENSPGNGAGVADFLETLYTEYGEFKGKAFGRVQQFPDSYTILLDANKIRVDNSSDITSIELTYLSMPEKVGGKSVIHPFAKSALNSWIDWQWARYNKEKDQDLRRRDYFNDVRVLRAAKNKMTTIEIKRSVWKSTRLSIK